jgi:predicted RNA-binding Zn-ribbon protein involved in translation (DUF1610 family)
MQNDPGTEWTRLTRLYADKSDEELLDLATDFGNLTETAQTVLRDELRKRKLGTPETVGSKQPQELPAIFGRWSAEREAPEKSSDADDSDSVDEEGSQELLEFTWKTLLYECSSEEEVWERSLMIQLEGIENWTQGLQIMVAADQLDEARAILTKPIPLEIINEYRTRDDAFVAPTCPKCGGRDPQLESIDPTNTWRCENCGATWTDPASVENEGPNPS